MASIRAHLDAVGGAQVLCFEMGLRVLRDSPDLTRSPLPVGIAGVERAVRGDGQVVGLIHPRFVDPNGRRSRTGRYAKDIVAGIIGDEHHPRRREPDAIARAGGRERDEDLRVAVRRDAGNGLGVFQTDAIKGPRSVARWALDASGESARGQGGRVPEFSVRCDSQKTAQTSDGSCDCLEPALGPIAVGRGGIAGIEVCHVWRRFRETVGVLPWVVDSALDGAKVARPSTRLKVPTETNSAEDLENGTPPDPFLRVVAPD